jgi:hypothetical protein
MCKADCKVSPYSTPGRTRTQDHISTREDHAVPRVSCCWHLSIRLLDPFKHRLDHFVSINDLSSDSTVQRPIWLSNERSSSGCKVQDRTTAAIRVD